MTTIFGPSLHLSRFLVDMVNLDGHTTEYTPPDPEKACVSVGDVCVAVDHLFANGSKNKRVRSQNDLLLEYLAHLDAEEPEPAVVEAPDTRSSVAMDDDPPTPVKNSYVKVKLPTVEGGGNGNTSVAQPYRFKFEKTRKEKSVPEKLSSDTKNENDTMTTTAEDLKPAAELIVREENNDVPSRTSMRKPRQSASSSPSHSQTNKANAPVNENDHPPATACEPEEDHILSWTNATLKDILAHIRNDLDERRAHRSNDASPPDDRASLNTRNETWTISSFHTNKSTLSDADGDSILDIAVPPDAPDDEDWSLPMESLLKPIKKNTYGQIAQERVQEFLAGAVWGAESSEHQKKETLWTAKGVPCRQVDHPVGADAVLLTTEDGDITQCAMEARCSPDMVDPFLESIENGGRPNRWIRPTGPRRLRETWRERQYPGPTVLYSEAEFYGEHKTGDARHRVYIKQLSTQSPTPDYYRRHRQNTNVPSGQSSVFAARPDVLSEPQLSTHRVRPRDFQSSH